MLALAWTLLALGGLIVLHNIYFAYLHFPLHLLRGRARENFHFVSVIGGVGSIVLLWSAILFQCRNPQLMWVSLALNVLDTGGLAAFAWLTVWRSIRGAN